MAVKIRLARVGAKKTPIYRVVVTDARNPRDGRHLEHIGLYGPRREPKIRIQPERLAYWLRNGAQPSETVQRLISRAGCGAPTSLPAAA